MLFRSNILNASIIREAAKLQRDTYNLWVKYKETHGGDAASFSAFEGSPEYADLKKETKARLLKKFPKQFKPVDDEEEKPTSILTFMGVEEPDPEKNLSEWKKHWVGMPEFVQEDKLPAKKLIINFRTDEDFKKFSELYMKHVDTNLDRKSTRLNSSHT